MRRCPREWIPILAAVQAYAEGELPDSLAPTVKSCIVAMVMSVWMTMHNQHGSFRLSSWNASSLMTTYKNCKRVAGGAADLSRDIIDDLIEKGMFPPGTAQLD
jgi:hypothetical protein